MNKERVMRDMIKAAEGLQKTINKMIEDMDDTPKPKAGRSHSVSACVTFEEKIEIDALCDDLREEYGKMTRGAFLRLVWLHFAEHHADIDLTPYKD